MQRRILASLALLLVAIVAAVGFVSLRDTSDAATVHTVQAAVPAALAPDPIELAPVQAVSLREVPASARKSKPPPIQTTESDPRTLALVLRHPNGRPLLESLEGLDREAVDALTPVLVEVCPMIGADLPSDARKLVHRTTNVREDRTGAWMRSSFREPTRGCACVLLGERVIAAAPFDVEQRSVDLTVRPDDLKSVRRNLEVFVVDDQNRVPLAGAQVTLTPVLGRPLIRNTDANGRASWQDLMPGEATLSVTLGNYRSYGQRLTLSSDRGRLPETIGLSRKTIVSGTVRWLVTDPQPATIVLLAVDSNAEVTRTVVTPDSGFTANFRFKDLKPAEYRLGVATDRTYPTVDQVRRREVEGWMIVDARFSDARFLWVDVTRTLLDPPSPR